MTRVVVKRRINAPVENVFRTIGETVFSVKGEADQTLLTMTMVAKAVEKDMDAVKSYCEEMTASTWKICGHTATRMAGR